jgi:ATP-dependent RNA helicase DeaD
MGMMDGFNRNSLKDFLADIVKVHQRMIFNLDVKSSFSFFETESKLVDNFLAINSADIDFNNRKVQLEVSKRRMHEGGGEGKRGGGGYKGGNGGGNFKGDRKRDDFGKRKRSDDGRNGEKKSFGKGEFRKEKSSFGGKKSFGKSRF